MKRGGTLHFALHERGHVLTPGLFRCLGPRDRKEQKLDVTWDYGDGWSVQFVGPWPLGPEDLRVLQGLVAMAGPRGLLLRDSTEHEAGRQMWLDLDPRWDAAKTDAMVVKGSLRELARAVGFSAGGGGALRVIRDSIERLYAITVFVRHPQEGSGGFRLLSDYAQKGGGVWVALNPLLAVALTGGRHVRIEMEEVRQLKSNPGRLIHQRLCGWINPGGTGTVNLDTLVRYAWPDRAPSRRSVAYRRGAARRALRELEGLGWRVEEVGGRKQNKTFQCSRPRPRKRIC